MAAKVNSIGFGLKPGRNIALTVQHPPNIDVVRLFDVKNTMWVADQWPKPKTRQVQFVGIPWRSRSGVPTDVGIGFFQRINQTESGRRRTFV